MTDGRHAPDTLFLVAEGDFRFYREHCVSNRNWLSEVDDFVEKHLKTATSVDARDMLNPAVPPEEEPITPTSDDEGGGGSEPEEKPDWGGPDDRASDAETEPDARREAKKKRKRKRQDVLVGIHSGQTL